jgi:DNA-binding NarL/FixJ family response regulator
MSPNEISILKLLQEGSTNKDIARSLGVAEVTIKSHLTKLYRKFGVRSRLELLAYAMTHHLIAEKNQVRKRSREPHREH